jgi:2-C-methyl-D-erythritol 4-phosphate cytidylyltransferase
MAVSAVIVAGGSGSRFGRKKQFLDLSGVPLIRRSVEAFSSHPDVESVVVVVPADDMDLARGLLAGIDAPLLFAAGGAARQESVMNGLALIGDSGLVLIHDAARPLVTAELISRVLEGMAEADGCIPALAVSSTLKEVREGVVARTVPRAKLFEAQTPQAFPTAVILNAHQRAREQGVKAATDDSTLVEAAGGVVRVVGGDPSNIKVTIEQDLVLAEALLACRSRSA